MTGRRHTCQHMSAKYGNCGGPHSATTETCPKIQEAQKRLSKQRGPSASPLGGQKSVQAMISSSPDFTVVVASQEVTQAPERVTSQPQPKNTQPPQAPKTLIIQGDVDIGNVQTSRAGTGPSSIAEC